MSTHPQTTPPASHLGHAVVFYSYPKLLFCWPLILVGYLFWPFTHDSAGYSAQLEFFGWAYIFVAFIVIMALSVDIERNYAIFLTVMFLAVFFLGMWLSTFPNFTLFGDIYRWFANLDLQYNRNLGLVLSILLTLPFGAMFLIVRLNDKWRITHNEFEHHSWGRADDSLARGAKRVRSTYPDLLELLLAGAGTLIVYSANGNTELRRIPHVPMLPMVRRKIDALLETVAVTPTADIAAEEEAAAEAAAHEHEEHHGEDDKEPL